MSRSEKLFRMGIIGVMQIVKSLSKKDEFSSIAPFGKLLLTIRLQEVVDRLNKRAKAMFPKAVQCANLKSKIENRQRLDVNVTPRSKANFQKLKKNLQSKTKRLVRKDKKIYELEQKIQKINSKDEKGIQDF